MITKQAENTIVLKEENKQVLLYVNNRRSTSTKGNGTNEWYTIPYHLQPRKYQYFVGDLAQLIVHTRIVYGALVVLLVQVVQALRY